MSARSAWLSEAFGAGLLAVFVGERLVPSGPARAVCTTVGVLVALGSFAWRLGRSSSEEDDPRATVEGTFAALQDLP